jgi:hypothetical protein
MPTDTDFSVFSAAGIEGANLAFFSDISAYHTPGDLPDRLAPGALQHQGESALGLILALQAEDLGEDPGGEAVFFDLYARALIYWPRNLTFPLTLVFAWMWWGAGRRPRSPDQRAVLVGLSTAVRALAAGVAAGVTVHLTLQGAGALPGWWIAEPASPWAALWSAAILAAGFTLRSRPCGPEEIGVAVWSLWGAVALLLSLLCPELCYPFLLPFAVAATGFFAAQGRRPSLWIWAAPAVTAGAIWFPLAWVQHYAAGFAFKAAVPGVAAWLLVAHAPLLVGKRGPGRGVGVTLAGALAVFLSVSIRNAPYTDRHPQRVSLIHHQEAGRARWLAEGFFGPPPPSLAQVGGFGSRPGRPFPWSTSFHLAYGIQASESSQPPPDLQLVEDISREGLRYLTIRIRSRRGGSMAGVMLPPGIPPLSVRVEEAIVPIQQELRSYDWGGGWRSIACEAIPEQGVLLRVVLPEGRAFVGVLFDVGPPEQAPGYQPLRAARPSWAVESHHGDRSLMTRGFKL